MLQDPERRFRRVGETKERTADVEVVCASHLAFEALRKRLDPDLFDRVSLLLVEIPPLRDCREDLREDWARVWGEIGIGPQEAPPWNDSIMRALQADPLPGNLRDLQRLALHLRAHGAEEGDYAATSGGMLAWSVMQARFHEAEAEPASMATRLDGRSWEEQVLAFKQKLARTGRREHGSYVAAAKALGVSERMLRQHAKRKKSNP
jgi:DNA-binding NtrC family response regulator